MQSLQCSACKHGAAQEVLERYWHSHMGVFKNVLESLPPDDIGFLCYKAHLHLSVLLHEQNLRYRSANNQQLVHEQPS